MSRNKLIRLTEHPRVGYKITNDSWRGHGTLIWMEILTVTVDSEGVLRYQCEVHQGDKLLGRDTFTVDGFEYENWYRISKAIKNYPKVAL